MIKLIQSLTVFATFFLLLVSCGSTKKITKVELSERIAKLERENTALKKDMEIMQRKMYKLLKDIAEPNPRYGSSEPQPNPNSTVVEGAGGTQIPINATTITFEKTTHDFGVMKEGDSPQYIFKFKNTGQEPLLIAKAKASCGCTVPQWPKDPIAPGESGEIQVQFHSKGKKGQQYKAVTIEANTNPVNTRIYIRANIEAAK